MAVNENKPDQSSQSEHEPMLRFKGRQWIIGANVFVMVVLALGLLVFANFLAFTFNQKGDMTVKGVNSLSPETRRMVDGLKENVTMTSLYQTFQDPAVETEAKKFRGSVEDLLRLYQTRAPSKIDVSLINPAKDRDKILKLVDNLRKKNAYQGEAKKHKGLVEDFNSKIAPAMMALFEEEQKQMKAFLDAEKGLENSREYNIILRNYQTLSQQADRVKEEVGAVLGDDLPKYSTAVEAIKGFYEQVKVALTSAGEWMGKVDEWGKGVGLAPPKDVKFFTGASQRYKAVLDQIEGELGKAKDLPTLKLEEIDRQVRPDTIIVETKDEVRVLSFDDVWQAKQKGQWGQPIGNTFKDRLFAGEAEVSSALLQLTQTSKPAVVFVRYGGQPLFFGGMMMGGEQALYAGAKERLEKANFIVKEWDVSAKKEPPDFEAKEKPARILWVLLKPDMPQPPRGMPPQMRPQSKPFGPEEREAVVRAMGDNPRVMFMAGWVPPSRNMMMGPPPIYEYNDYLKETWGMEVQYNYPVLEAFSFEPGKWGFRRNPFNLTRYEFSTQTIVAPISGLKGVFPEASPIKEDEPNKLPDGVTLQDLVIVPNSEDIWAESDIEGLSQELQKQRYTKKGKMDMSGPFPIAVAGTRTKDGKVTGKVVLVSSRGFATDAVALARGMVPAGEGFMLVMQSPANLEMFINGIHWLNDNEGLIGKGVQQDIPRLDLKPGVGYTMGKVSAVILWPLMGLLAGVAVWFVRRR